MNPLKRKLGKALTKLGLRRWDNFFSYCEVQEGMVPRGAKAILMLLMREGNIYFSSRISALFHFTLDKLRQLEIFLISIFRGESEV